MTKTCTNCQKPFSGLGGRNPFCQDCRTVGDDKKRCCKCREVKALDQFDVSRGRPAHECKSCMKVRNAGNYGKYPGNLKRWKAANPDKVFNSSMRKQGIDCTWEQQQEMLTKQGNVCAICHRPEKVVRDGKQKALAVDHDHQTGKVRGLICSACNQGLGNFQDNPDLLRNAVFYLEQHRC